MARIRLLCDIDIDVDPVVLTTDPKQWDWHGILGLSEGEQIWVYGASLNPTEEADGEVQRDR